MTTTWIKTAPTAVLFYSCDTLDFLLYNKIMVKEKEIDRYIITKQGLLLYIHMIKKSYYYRPCRKILDQLLENIRKLESGDYK